MGKKFDIPVYATQLVHSGMDKNYCMRCKIARSSRNYVEPGVAFNIGDFTVTPISVPHDSSDNAGYMIECDGTVFTLLTDVGHITDDMKEAIKKSHYLVLEANYDPQMLEIGPYPRYLKDRIKNGNGHLSNIQCAEAILENYSEKLRHVWLCHLSEENNTPDKALNCVKTMLAENNIPVDSDLTVEPLRRKLPTGVFQL